MSRDPGDPHPTPVVEGGWTEVGGLPRTRIGETRSDPGTVTPPYSYYLKTRPQTELERYRLLCYNNLVPHPFTHRNDGHRRLLTRGSEKSILVFT